MAPEGEYIAIAAGQSHSLALSSDGSIVGWGNNKYGQATPPEGNDFIAIAAGHLQSLAIRRESDPNELVED
jgi:alpha-tubulin suppressor-like RCC1 family protein